MELLEILEVRRETPEAVSIVFKQPNHTPYHYYAGQYLTLEFELESELVRRQYSLSSAPGVDPNLVIGVKHVEGGRASGYLTKQVKKGDLIKIAPPAGRFVVHPLKEAVQRHFIFFAAGSGITPLLSMIKVLLHEETHSRIGLVYGNRTRESTMYKRELDNLEERFPGRFVVVHVLSRPDDNWVGFTGRINEATAYQLSEQLMPLKFRQALYYICGPEGMKSEVIKALDLLNVPKEQIFTESFNLPTHKPEELLENNFTGKSKIIVHDGPKKFEFEVSGGKTILETANKLGINLPYSCQAGLCTACMAKCISGKVRMTESEGLTDKEIQDGYILTCVSHPESAEVILEF